MLKQICKISLLLCAMDAGVFLVMVITSMTDDKISALTHSAYWVLKYVLGFPMVLVKSDFPFFLDSIHLPIHPILIILSILLNNLILSGPIVLLLRLKQLFKKKSYTFLGRGGISFCEGGQEFYIDSNNFLGKKFDVEIFYKSIKPAMGADILSDTEKNRLATRIKKLLASDGINVDIL